jgi:hypothetical protein
MIRFVYVLRRRAGMSLAEFQGYWRREHGPRVARHSTHLAISRYIQLHTLEDPANEAMRASRGLAEPYDGVAELWWNNTEEAAAAGATAEGQAASAELVEDEKKFIDFSRSSLWFATDVPQINPTPENIVATERNSLVKLFYVFHRLPTLAKDQAQLYWRMNHGPLIRRHAQAARILRYIQVHALDDALAEPIRAARGKMEEAYDGHAELWYDRAGGGVGLTAEGQRAAALFHEDEKKFIDFSRSAMWFGKEVVFIDL